LSLEIICLQENKHKRSENPTVYDACIAMRADEVLPHWIPRGHATSPIQVRQATVNQSVTHGHHPKRLNFMHPPRIYPRAHTSVTWRKGSQPGPQAVRPNRLVSAGLIPSRGSSLLVQRVIPRCFTASWVSNLECPRPINRRGGGSFVDTHICSLSLFHF
jgi:hypothetical protein